MTAGTVTVDPELAKAALGQVLDDDAAAQPAAPPPPKRERPPDATDEAPWGFKPDGSARKGPPGPGRPRKDAADKPRVDDKPPAPAASPATPAPGTTKTDYSQDIGAALTMAWMGLSAVPWTRAHAAVVRRYTPQMVPAWNAAAQQNATIRGYVMKLSGEGSWGWVIPVTVTTAPLVIGLWQVTRDPQARAQLAAENDVAFGEFIRAQAAAAGIDLDDGQDGDEDAGEQEAA